MRTFTRTSLTTTAIAGLLIAGAAGAAHAAPAGTAQTFQLHYNSAVSEQVGQVIGHGPISGTGTDVENIGDTGGQATFTFRDGTVVLNVHIGSETPALNLTACQAKVALEGTWEIDHGTGAYAAATGSGTYSGSRMIYGTRIKGVCQGPDSGVEPRMSTENVVLTGAVSAG